MKPLRILLLPILISINLFAQENVPVAEHGVLDARAWDFNQGKIPLNGYWNFYKNELINVSDSITGSGNVSVFPEIWDSTVQYATYQLLVIMPSDTGTYALEMPQLYCSYVIWVNGEKAAENGKVGSNKETTTPQWLPKTAALGNPGDTLSIVLQISNFYHSKGGAKEPIYLGKSDMVQHYYSISLNSSLIESIVLTILGLSFFVIYYVREERKKITFYFSLLCINWAIRAIFSNTYAFTSFFPDFNWGLMVRIEYITLFLMMIWAILFLARLFPNESSKTIKYILVGVNCIFMALTIVSSPVFFTQWLNVYLSTAGVLLFFGVTVVVRAWINERSGARYVVFCVLLSIALFSFDIFVYEGLFSTYNAVLFSVSYLVLFLLLGISLLYHLQIFKGDGSSGTLTFEDLYGKTK